MKINCDLLNNDGLLGSYFFPTLTFVEMNPIVSRSQYGVEQLSFS